MRGLYTILEGRVPSGLRTAAGPQYPCPMRPETAPVPQPAPKRPAPARSRLIAESLSAAIHEHRLHPGVKLSEDEVGEIFGVSRTLVRAALLELAQAHLVTIEPRRGAFVARPSQREAREVFEARALLEPQIAARAALRVTPADLDALRARITAEHQALAAGDTGRALRQSGLFHIAIARIADQQTVAELIEQLVARSSLIIALYWRRAETTCESTAHHALLDALAAHDGPRTEALMRRHLEDLGGMLDFRDTLARSLTLKEALGR